MTARMITIGDLLLRQVVSSSGFRPGRKSARTADRTARSHQRVGSIHGGTAADDGRDMIRSAVAGQSISRLTMVGAANIEVRGEGAESGKIPQHQGTPPIRG